MNAKEISNMILHDKEWNELRQSLKSGFLKHHTILTIKFRPKINLKKHRKQYEAYKCAAKLLDVIFHNATMLNKFSNFQIENLWKEYKMLYKRATE